MVDWRPTIIPIDGWCGGLELAVFPLVKLSPKAEAPSRNKLKLNERHQQHGKKPHCAKLPSFQ